MNIDVIISANHINEEYLKNKIVVVIDMLRATSVIATAINNGAKEVIPILTVEEALKKKEELKANGIEALLGGERKAVKIDGFDFTNSPLEYTKEKIEGKTIILTTTNGTRAINLSKKAKKILIASMLNARAVVDALKNEKEDIIFINAGTNGEFSMDDYICSGYMISLLCRETCCNLSDISKTAKIIYENNINIIDFIKEAKHYNILKSLNLENDLYYCIKKDIIKIVPYFNKYKNSIEK
ncbi:2-phosphosulfolactate phosphatase family protein [Clostridium isatidis]|uniref:Probable 2-phosphosulfolactate phosphatase n=1 Tax=Clostridium isatidis TaxID=182773 RepID=A0A343J903_9CLOT|nr:2-phosphosulfolactate phosphatase family protein [Clostridium isatidis]ASW42011.1 2-phosphosulfolactate phosphatase [Clostridium isatidis]NLZ35079.1 2-phosphosulfolactate phosphatase family protein [Clostridiales bacterium]